ncbi:soma ferritin-like [Ylistrum balloti]|uniref:soma ferritin-like n=1 Tax=Ylistrum balloti TaxID=509963 RepID=UPI002905E521|nr:soma ferritin-like [Ylistrum balloti]
MYSVGVLVSILAWLTYVGPGNSQSPQVPPPVKSANELYGFDEVKARSFMVKNIKTSFQSYYTYLAISYCFARHNISLPGFEKLFRSYTEMERQNAEKIMLYMIQRGMTFEFHSINPSKKLSSQCYERADTGATEWSYVMSVIDFALGDQKHRLNLLKKTHYAAVTNDFPHLKHFLEDECMDQKYLKIKEIADIHARLKRIKDSTSPNLGLYLFDRSLLS